MYRLSTCAGAFALDTHEAIGSTGPAWRSAMPTSRVYPNSDSSPSGRALITFHRSMLKIPRAPSQPCRLRRRFHATRAGYPTHPSGNVAGVGDRERLDRLPRTCSKGPMRAPIVSRIRTWLLAGMERLWSQLAPAQGSRRDRIRRRGRLRRRRELVIENAVFRHQVNVLRRRSKQQKLHVIDRLKLLLGARWLPSWRPGDRSCAARDGVALHRAGFRRFWRRRSRLCTMSPLPPETNRRDHAGQCRTGTPRAAAARPTPRRPCRWSARASTP
jgi:hypothetical protein